MDRPNILYLHSHDTGRYIQPYGHAIPTPSLQRLAEQGVLFRQAHNAAPTCSPSRSALLTGQSPHSCGQFGLVNRGFLLQHAERHLANFLAGEGYSTTLVGTQHEVRDPTTAGYQQVTEVSSRCARDVAPAAARLLRDGLPGKPFFMSVGFIETHREFPQPTTAEDARYCRPPDPLPDTSQTRADMAAFAASARELDWGMGFVLQALEDAGFAEETLVICTTDHGIAFPSMKCNLTDHGTGVMLILRGPGGCTGGRVSDALVSQIDLFPTICDVAGLDSPPWLEGVSLSPLIREGSAEVRQELNAEISFHANYEPQRSVRTGRWKYIRRFTDRGLPYLANCDASPSKDLWIEGGWRERPVVQEELYDLLFDPGERANVAMDSNAAEELGHLRERLRSWMERTSDPLLRGAMEAPAGATVNRPDDVHPAGLWEYTPKPGGQA